MTQAFVAGIGLRGPGLNGWAASRAVLAGTEAWTAAPTVVPPTTLLAPNERRRAGLPARLALTVAAEAVEMAGLPPDAVRGVFGSANGEGVILHGLLETLTSEAPLISPTQFHNSVHNAVAGYWAMGARSHQPVTCLGAHAGTFAATLLKALAEVAEEQAPVLMCVYDVPLPEPLSANQPTGCAFACALVLTPAAGAGALAGLAASWQAAPPACGADLPRGAALAALSRDNPAARSLRVLQAIAAGTTDRAASFGLLDGAVRVQVDPCSTATPSAP